VSCVIPEIGREFDSCGAAFVTRVSEVAGGGSVEGLYGWTSVWVVPSLFTVVVALKSQLGVLVKIG
jgi:hypothetical protein